MLSDMYLILWLRHIIKQKFKYHSTSKPSALYFKIAKAHWQISVLYIIYSINTDLFNSYPNYIIKNNDTVYHFRNIQCRYFYFLRYTKQNVFLYTIISHTEFNMFSLSGPGGNRTRVQKPVPCTSTIIVSSLTFPLPHEN